MPADTLPAAIAVQVFTEAPQQVTAHAIGDRAVLTIGDDRSGVRLLGDIAAVRQVVAQARHALENVDA